MTERHENLFGAIERLFHEPSRMAIMTALCGASDGLAFTELKEQCDLTDGNLNRHLKTLEDARAVRIRKTFVGLRPRTTVFATPRGREEFLQYLRALEQALKAAASAVKAEGLRPSATYVAARARA